MLEQDAYHLYFQQILQVIVLQGINDRWIVFNAALSRSQWTLHIGIHRQAMTAIDGEEHRVCQEPLFRFLLYTLSGIALSLLKGGHNVCMNSTICL